MRKWHWLKKFQAFVEVKMTQNLAAYLDVVKGLLNEARHAGTSIIAT